MKILISAYACDPTCGSEPGCGWNWAYHSARLGHEVWCFTRVTNKENIETWLTNSPVSNLHFVYVTTPMWLERAFSKHRQLAVYFHYSVWQYRAYLAAKKLLERVPLDLVHHVTYGSIQMGSHLWKLNIPFVFGPVGGAQTTPRSVRQYIAPRKFHEKLRSLVGYILLYVVRNAQKAIQSAALVLVTNQGSYDLVEKLGAKRVNFLLDGGIPDDFAPRSLPAHPVGETLNVLWVGRIVSNKGLALVIDVFKALNKAYPIQLNIIGDGASFGYFKRRVAQLGLADTITFHGNVPFHVLRQYYASSDAFIYCGLRNAMGIQILEAMAYGLPLVALNLHGVRTFIPKGTGIQVELTNTEQIVDELKDALILLSVDQHKRQEFGRKAYQFAKTQTWSEKVKWVSEQRYPYLTNNYRYESEG